MVLPLSIRALRKTPGFTVVAVSVLALGVGANTAMFSVIDAVLLRPLPYPDAERVVWIGEAIKVKTTDEVTLTPDFLDWRSQNDLFTAMAAFNFFTRTLTGVGDIERVERKAACLHFRVVASHAVSLEGGLFSRRRLAETDTSSSRGND